MPPAAKRYRFGQPGEIRSGTAQEVQPHIPPGPCGSRQRFRQAHHKRVFQPKRPVIVAVHADAVQLPGRVEICLLDDAALIASTGSVTAGQAVPEIWPVPGIRVKIALIAAVAALFAAAVAVLADRARAARRKTVTAAA